MTRNLKASLDISLVNAKMKSAYSVNRKSRSLNLNNREVSLRAWRALQRIGFSRSVQDKTKDRLCEWKTFLNILILTLTKSILEQEDLGSSREPENPKRNGSSNSIMQTAAAPECEV